MKPGDTICCGILYTLPRAYPTQPARALPGGARGALLVPVWEAGGFHYGFDGSAEGAT